MQTSQRRQRSGLVMCHRVGEALFDLDVVAVAKNFFDAAFGHDGTGQVRAIAAPGRCRGITSARRTGRPMEASIVLAAQPGIDGGGGDLSGADRLHGGSWAMLGVSAGEDAGHVGHQRLRSRRR